MLDEARSVLTLAEHGLVEGQEHLVLVQVDRLGGDGVATNKRADDDTERVLGCRLLIEALVDGACRRPALGLL